MERNEREKEGLRKGNARDKTKSRHQNRSLEPGSLELKARDGGESKQTWQTTKRTRY